MSEKVEKNFKRLDSKIYSESFFVAKINDEIKSGFAIASQLLKSKTSCKKLSEGFFENKRCIFLTSISINERPLKCLFHFAF